MEEKEVFEYTVLVVGLPQHITIACCREHSDHVVFEFFDPAGPAGDLQSVKAVKQWAEHFLQTQYSQTRSKKVTFNNITKSTCFQSDKSDVMCQTWIWYWVYWRMVRQAPAVEIIGHIKTLTAQKKSLTHIQKFNKWMIELFKLGYFVKENVAEAAAAEKASPMKYDRLVEVKQKRIMKRIEELETELYETERNQDIMREEDEGMEDIDENMMIKLTLHTPRQK